MPFPIRAIFSVQLVIRLRLKNGGSIFARQLQSLYAEMI
jgi:hypothetical protein